MPSPFPIKSRDYFRAEAILQKYRQKRRKKGLADLPDEPLLSLLDRAPDARGTFKKVFFEESDNTVLFLEIGLIDFVETRRRRMQALSAFSDDENLLLPLERQLFRMKTDEGVVCFLVSSTNRCSVDLFLSLTGAQELDSGFVLEGLMSLSKTISRLNLNGIFFTDVKLENIVVCGTDDRRLAFIDLDSIILEEEIRTGKTATISKPPANYFALLKDHFLRDEEVYVKTPSARFDDLLRFNEFYTLFAFSFMVFEVYFFYHRRDQVFSTSPSSLLPASEEKMQLELEGVFERPMVSGNSRGKKKMILMAYRVLQYVLRSSDFAEKIILDTWYDTLKSDKERREKKAARRRDLLNGIRKTSSSRLLLL